MTFPDIAAKPSLTAESRGGFLLPQTRETWLTAHLWNIEYCLQYCWKLKYVFNQRTNGPVNAHLISWPSKAQNKQNLENIW